MLLFSLLEYLLDTAALLLGSPRLFGFLSIWAAVFLLADLGSWLSRNVAGTRIEDLAVTGTRADNVVAITPAMAGTWNSTSCPLAREGTRAQTRNSTSWSLTVLLIDLNRAVVSSCLLEFLLFVLPL